MLSYSELTFSLNHFIVLKYMHDINIEQTADGSNTLYVPQLDEHYHSVKGAFTESQHIFIDMGLRHFIDMGVEGDCSPVAAVRVFEVGFGTGLNTFLTLLEAEDMRCPIHYTTVERYPLPASLWQELQYPAWVGRGHLAEFTALHQAPWEADVAVTPHFTLHKIEGDFTRMQGGDASFDVIYFDAFAPEKQPEMWSQAIFDDLFRHLSPGGILTTYCAKGVVRRMLQAAGFVVERLAGPPGGKREILRGTKPR